MFFVVEGVYVEFQCVFQKLVEQDVGLFFYGGVYFVQIGGQFIYVVYGVYGLFVEDVIGLCYQWEVEFGGEFLCLGGCLCYFVFWLWQVQVFVQGVEIGMVFGFVNGFGGCVDDWCVCICQFFSEFEGCLFVELYDYVYGFFVFNDVYYVFEGQWFEVQVVGGVVVGVDCFGVGVDYDCFVFCFLKCLDGVDGGVVEFYFLFDVVGVVVQNDYFGFVGGGYFVFLFVGVVVVWCVCFEFGGVGVYCFVDGCGFGFFVEVVDF